MKLPAAARRQLVGTSTGIIRRFTAVDSTGDLVKGSLMSAGLRTASADC
jgi:hypothetical protein